MKIVTLTGTTDASGNLTVTSPTVVQGLLYAVQKIDGTLDDGVDITVTAEHSEISVPLFAQLNFNADGMAYPRVAETSATDGTSLSSTCMPIVIGAPTMIIAQGGNTKTGGCILYIVDV